MMKKNGFTLAEVLVTLGIIGVVAVMSLPNLMSNTAEATAKTGVKKAVMTLSAAAKSNEVGKGFDYDSAITKSVEDADAQSLYALFVNNMDVDYEKSGIGTLSTGKAFNGTNYVLFFRDGSAISFKDTSVSSANGIKVAYDVNGAKGPNLLSNCHASTNATTEKKSGADCSIKNNRFIKDRFSFVLKGMNAIPNGPATRWAYEN